VIAETNLHDLAQRLFGDPEDFVAPGVAFVAHALAGGLASALVPSTDSYATIEPAGTSPLLDPLFSTERVRVDHDALTHSRTQKLAWLARERPDLVEHLRVCYPENEAGNCGRCGKCLLTMAGLQAVGALRLASEFPDEIDLEPFEYLRLRRFRSRLDWAEVYAALPANGEGGELRRRIAERLREAALTTPTNRAHDAPAWADPAGFRDHRLNAMLSLLLDGRPYPPADGAVSEPALGLLRLINRERDRHVYAVGAVPDGLELVGELGALHRRPGRGSIPAWVTWDGQLAVEGVGETRPGRLGRRPRWVFAPLAWRDIGDLGERVRAVGWRLRRAPRPPIRPEPPLGEPAGYLHRDPGPRRVPLYTARHPVTGDQLLATRPYEANELGYLGTTLAGYLDAEAGATGRLGTGRPYLPWGSRFGQRISE
jgi:hypothetical protein